MSPETERKLREMVERKIEEFVLDFVFGKSSGPDNVGLGKFVRENAPVDTPPEPE